MPNGPSVVAGDTVHLDVGGRSVAFEVAHPPDVDLAARAAAAHAHAGGSADLIAPMPGSVVTVHVAPGKRSRQATPSSRSRR